jgi:hypothetical protein
MREARTTVARAASATVGRRVEGEAVHGHRDSAAVVRLASTLEEKVRTEQ